MPSSASLRPVDRSPGPIRGAAVIVLGPVLALTGCTAGGFGEQPTPSPSPEPPAVAADYAEVGYLEPDRSLAALGYDASPLPDGSAIAGAHYSWELTGFAVAEQLSYEQRRELELPLVPDLPARDDPLLAGPGREFLLTEVRRPADSPRMHPSYLTLRVLVEGANRSIRGFPALERGGVIVVSVPAGGDAVLEVIDVGDAKSISLRTGESISGEDRPADTLRGESAKVSDFFRVGGFTAPGQLEGATAVVEVEPASFIDGPAFGRADPGQMWLRVEVALTVLRCEDCTGEQAAVSIDLGRSLTIQPERADPLPIPADAVVDLAKTRFPHVLSGEWSAIFEVPDDTRSFAVRLVVHGSYTAEDGRRATQFERHEDGQNLATLTLSESR